MSVHCLCRFYVFLVHVSLQFLHGDNKSEENGLNDTGVSKEVSIKDDPSSPASSILSSISESMSARIAQGLLLISMLHCLCMLGE